MCLCRSVSLKPQSHQPLLKSALKDCIQECDQLVQSPCPAVKSSSGHSVYYTHTQCVIHTPGVCIPAAGQQQLSSPCRRSRETGCLLSDASLAWLWHRHLKSQQNCFAAVLNSNFLPFSVYSLPSDFLFFKEVLRFIFLEQFCFV